MASEEVLAIVGARVIDGLGGDPIEKGTVVIERDRITAVGKDTAVPDPARRQGARCRWTHHCCRASSIATCIRPTELATFARI